MSIPADVAVNKHYSWTQPTTLESTETRETQMERLVDEWASALEHNITTPMGAAQIEDWIRMQARIPHASPRNAILLIAQQPAATDLKTYDGWIKNTPGQQHTALRGTSAIWLWDPLVARQCPTCGNAHFEHDVDDRTDPVSCTEVPPAQWNYAVIRSTPTALFAREQFTSASHPTDSPPRIRPPTVGPDEHSIDLSEDRDPAPDPGRLPTYRTAAGLRDDLPAVAERLPIQFKQIPEAEWSRINRVELRGRDTYTLQPAIEVLESAHDSRFVTTVLHHMAEALLCPDLTGGTTYRQRRVEVALATYGVCLALGHGTAVNLDIEPPYDELERWGSDSSAELIARCRSVQTMIGKLLQAFTAVA